jgi:hypothetical protein
MDSDAVRVGLLKDHSRFHRDLSAPFYGANGPGAEISQGLRDRFRALSMQVGLKAACNRVKAFPETDMIEDLKRRPWAAADSADLRRVLHPPDRLHRRRPGLRQLPDRDPSDGG